MQNSMVFSYWQYSTEEMAACGCCYVGSELAKNNRMGYSYHLRALEPATRHNDAVLVCTVLPVGPISASRGFAISVLSMGHTTQVLLMMPANLSSHNELPACKHAMLV